MGWGEGFGSLSPQPIPPTLGEGVRNHGNRVYDHRTSESEGQTLPRRRFGLGNQIPRSGTRPHALAALAAPGARDETRWAAKAGHAKNSPPKVQLHAPGDQEFNSQVVGPNLAR